MLCVSKLFEFRMLQNLATHRCAKMRNSEGDLKMSRECAVIPQLIIHNVCKLVKYFVVKSFPYWFKWTTLPWNCSYIRFVARLEDFRQEKVCLGHWDLGFHCLCKVEAKQSFEC